MISHRYKCIFIHIPKTGGTSVEAKLRLFKKLTRDVQDHRAIIQLEPISGSKLVQKFQSYWGERDFKKIWLLLSGRERMWTWDAYHHYFKFAIVRNSWSRIFSWYRAVIRHNEYYGVQDYGVPTPCSFEEFIKKYLNGFWTNSQLSWITDREGKIAVDFVMRYETLQKDFSTVCDRLGIADQTLPHLLQGDNPNYVTFYTSETRGIVAKKYAEEIKYFNFEFGQ